MRDYDIVVVGDLRFPGGTSMATAEELTASASAGYRCGVIHLRSPVLKYPHPINPRIRELIDRDVVALLDPRQPVSARLACLYHPQTVTHRPLRASRINAETRLLIVNHPPNDTAGQPHYDWTATHEHAQELLGGPVSWAPVGPAVRAQFTTIADSPPLHPADWYGVVAPSVWRTERQVPNGNRPVIGRHSRPDALKWPDSREQILTVYPDDPGILVRVLGDGPFLRDLVSPYPENWQVWPFNGMTPQEFLAGIDVFVYYHHSRWVEAFGFCVIEAMASGAPPILPVHFEELFGDAAIYAQPDEVADVIRTLHASPTLYRQLSDQAVDAVHSRFSHSVHQERVRQLIGPPVSPGPLPAPSTCSATKPATRGTRRVMFVSSNGVGMGHLTRLLAIARRCSREIEPVFLTMSRAAHYVLDFGYPVEFLPFHGQLQCDIADWNHHLRNDIGERLDFYRPDVVVFDGNVPYGGLISALAGAPECLSVWCRRAMWRPGAGKEHVVRERHFAAVIEPQEIAAELDRGRTTTHRTRTREVGPITLLNPADLLDRTAARRQFGLDPDRPAVLLQLGSGNNYDMGELRQHVLETLLTMPDWQVVWLDSAITENPVALPDSVRRIAIYPIVKYVRAFDFVISAAGYNAYHELLINGVPTIFVPNENPTMDDQLARATLAESRGLAYSLRAHERYRVAEVIQRMAQPAERQSLVERCARLGLPNGGDEAARFVEELVYCCRADLDPAGDLLPLLRRRYDA